MIEGAPIECNLTYNRAFLYMLTCTHNGHNDWRFPTYQETYDIGIGWSWTDSPAFQDPDIDLMHLILVRDKC
jgi:hypothetical protein